MEIFNDILYYILQLDEVLIQFISKYGHFTYFILFAIIFLETGVVILPFLPGDSLLFATGVLAGKGDLNIFILTFLLIIAAVLGDSLNYKIGKKFGKNLLKYKLFKRQLVKPAYIKATEDFYEKYGSKTIIIARFVPIVRTFAPFVAGIGSMKYTKFITYNVVGAFVWVISLCFAGYFFGQIPWVSANFEKVIFGIIILSNMPVLYEIIKHKIKK